MAILTNQTSTIGTIENDSITGTAGNDALGGGAGNDTIVGGLSNDTVDGGAGINTYIIQGNADAFTRRVVYDANSGTASWQITDLVVGGLDLLNASDEGIDSLVNIQKLQFVLPDGTLDSEVVIDDFANSADVTNQEIQYGNWVSGRINYYGDKDWLRLSETVGQKYVMFVGSSSASGTYIDGRYTYPSVAPISVTPATTQVKDFQIYTNSLSTTTPNNSSAYSFVLRRQLDGTVGNDTLDAGTSYEYLLGGAGDDILNGSVRSDYLSGGDGNDLLTGGVGSDELDGGAGTANVAVFSGNQADYSFQWVGSSDLALKVSHLNGGADGIDNIKNIQILRFADGDVVLDTQGSDPFGLLPNNIGQAMVGSLPGTGNSSMGVDQDAFAQKFSGLTTNSTLRVKLVTTGDSGNVHAQFKLIGTQDVLTFANATNPSQTYTGFDYNNVQQWDTSGNRVWFVTPQYWGSGQQAFAGDRADVSVSGYAYGDFGTFLNYSITVDRVQLGTASADTITGDGLSTYIDAQAGNDVVTGSALGEEIQGGAGDDTLNGGLGNDILVGGAGTNTLNGGDGDDTLDIRQSTTTTPTSGVVTDIVDGGAGVDTLVISASQNIANMTVTNVEILQADGGVSALTPAAVLAMGFTTANNITFRLDPNLANGGTLDASTLSGTLNLRGTNQSDVLKGNDQANIIYLQSDATVGSGNGVDTVVAGAGDDSILWSTQAYQQSSLFFSSVDSASKTFFIEGNIDGGTGTDTLSLNFGNSHWYHPWGNTWYQQNTPVWSLDLSKLSLTNVEKFEFTGLYTSRSWTYPNEVRLNAAQISSFATVTGLPAVGIVGGGAIDLSKLANLGISNWRIADNANYTITGTANADALSLGAGVITLSTGDGNDTITLDGKTSVVDTIDGGVGTDTLVIRGTDVDLSGATLNNIESIQVTAQSLSLTAAQWAATANVSRVAGANTAYILSVTTPGTTTLAADSAYAGLTGSSGDDRLIGNASNNILVGGAGSDELTGNAGDDRLVSGAGIDVLSGGEGDDTLVITGKATSRDSYDGGAGADTLQVTSSVDLTGASITGMEVLDGTGTVTMTTAQLAGFADVRGVTVQLSGISTELNLGATRLGTGATVLMPQLDPTLVVTTGILGSKGDDIITGSAGADVMYGGRGADRLDGGAGADVLIGGSGVDILFGGVGDDVFRVVAGELATGSSTTYSDIIDGGLGSDTLELNFSGSSAAWQTYQISTGSLTNVERLVVNNPYFSTVALTSDNWNALSSFTAQGNSYYDSISLAITGAGSNINFNAVNAGSNIGKLDLQGSFYSIDASNITLGQTADISYNTALSYHSIFVSSFDNMVLSGGNDLLQVNSDTSFTVNAGAGDDSIKVNVYGNANLTATIDGGSGVDTLDLSSSGFVDLTQTTLTNIESIKHGTATLVVTDTQLANWSFDGSGAKYTKVGNSIVGTANADSYTGDGTGSFQGGKGDDSINNVNTAVFTGNKADYDWTWANSVLTVQQSRGDLSDGKDTLNGVLNLKFADQTIAVDDRINNPFAVLQSGNLDQVELKSLDQAISGKKDYVTDYDVFKISLVPSSPIYIDHSSADGSAMVFRFIDITSSRELDFKSMTYGWINYGTIVDQLYSKWWSSATAEQKWMPGFIDVSGVFQPYAGGEVLVQVGVAGTGDATIKDYAFTVHYLDDYAGSIDTLGQMNAQTGIVKGYVGDIGDADWIRTDLIAGTKYEFHLNGVSSGGGTLVDPKLQLLDAAGRLIESGVSIALDEKGQTKAAGYDDALVFLPTESGSYYLSVTDVAKLNTGSWTLTQQSLDIIAGNTTTTERIKWSGAQTFTVNSEINVLSDHDWFKVWLDKGITYEFRALGASAGGTLSDPDVSIRSVTGILLGADDNGGIGSDAMLNYSAPDSGWYYLDVGASGNASKGTYILKGKTLADDFSNDVLTTGVVQTNGTALHGLATYIGDSDWIKVGLSRGVTYVIDLAGDISEAAQLDPLTDPLLTVRDANGNFIARFDDFGGTLNSRAYFTPTADGLYYLEAKSAFKYDIGAYQLTVTQAPPDDFAAAMNSSAAALTLGTVQAGNIGIPGDHDVFQMNLEAGKVYQLGVGGLSGHAGTLTDPYLRVFDSAGHLLDFDNNGGLGNDAQMYFAPTSTGTYYVEASSNNDRAMGSYSVTVAQRDMPADDVPYNLGTQVFLTPGDSFPGNLLTHNDQDWFGIKLIGGKDYVFRAQASHSGNGSLSDPVLEVRHADGTLAIPAVDNMLISNEPATSFTPVADGTYYLVVKAADGQTDTGTYTLVTRAPDDYSNTKPGADTIALDQTLDGAIQWSDGAFGVRAYDSVGLATDIDEDWFKFTATADQVLSVNVQIAQGSALSRPMVEVVDSLGRSMAVGDGLETNNGLAVATFRAPDAGTYFARVIDGAGATGAYKISLAAGDASDEDASGPVALDFANQGAIVQAQATAKIGLAGDTDAFTVSLQAGHSYRMETLAVRDGTHAPLSSAQLDLNWLAQGAATPEHISVAGEVASPSFFDSTLFEATTSGTMSINVAPLEATQTGQYKLRVVDLGTSQADDRPDAAANYVEATYGVLAANENKDGRIDTSSDIDLFAITLTAGNVYDFSVKSYLDGLGTLAQGSLRLLDATGQLVTAGTFDNVAGRTSLPVSVFEDGRYYLSVSAVDLPGNTGTYTLDTRLRGAAQASDDISADTRSGVSAGPGLPATGVINYAGDHDWIRASLEAGKVYVLDVLADGDGAGGTLKDATLRLLDAQGNEIAFDDNSGAALDSHLQFAVTSSGEYYLDVGSNGAETGTYTMRVRELYSGVADPLQSAQWYLSAAGIDALKGQITGAGVTVGVVDDGIDTSHPDLQNQLNFALAYDTQFNTKDGSPKYPVLIGLPPDNHGTMVAGIIAAEANNETGIVGVAPDAELVSTRVKWTWDQITEALGLQWQFDVSNNSWGAINPFGDNFNSTNLTFAWQALRTGVEDGRNGLGTVFVFSAGNSAANGDNTNYHNFQNAREVIAVGAADADGSMAGFSTPGANVLVSSYGVNMITTDRHQPGWGENGSSNYVTNFTGTSAAAPMISGITALMLEANPNLGYRDVQEILVYASTHPDNQDWKTNAASNFNLGGLQFNDKAGFGLVDAYSAVRLAQTWTDVGTAINEVSASARAFGLTDAIPDGTGAVYSRSFTIDSTMSVEHVELGVDVRHTRLGDLVIELTSPNGTVSTLMNRPTVNAEQPFGLSGTDSGVPTHLLWDFSSVQFWGEEASGTWTVTVKDVRAEETGSLSSLSLRVYGARDDGNDTYVFTEEGFQGQTTRVLSDESGTDTINASPMLHDMYVNLGAAALIASQGVTYKIADWSVIENAITGSGKDRLDGNDANNRLNGMEGNDTLAGGLGNDTLVGGVGSDVAYYLGAMAEFSKSWNPNTKTVTVVDNLTSNGNEGTDSLIGIERIVFSDGEISLSADVGNQAPVATALVFDSPVFMAKGVGIDYALPENAFSDPDGTAVANLVVSVADASGGELPDWLSYDPVTGKFSGVPPQDYQGQLKLLVTAVDEFGVSVSDILTLQFGDNQAPVLQSPSELLLAEDAGLVALNIAVPFDPEGKAVTIKLLDIPSQGAVLDKNGSQLAVGALMSADELSELHYQTLADGNGNAGYVRFQATDEDGVVSESSVHIFINPVNDAPRFATSSSTLVIQYPAQSTVTLDMQQPSDPESVLATVRLIELPALGSVTLDGQAVQLDQVMTFDQLQRLSFTLNESVNGPIGAVTIQAVDPQGAASNWSLALEVQGDVAYSTGTAGADALYGSIGNDTLYGMAGEDVLVGNAGNDRLLGGLGNDKLFGGSGNDALDGSSGNDYLDGGTGADAMSGGPGADTYFVDSSGDVVLEVISGGAGGKDLIITSVSLTAPTNVEGLQAAVGAAVISLTGNGLDNTLLGNEADNLLSGYAGRDTLLGAQGNDTLDGGSGVDRMAGGTGNDVYFVDSRSDAVIELASEGLDTVKASASFTLGSNVENLVLQGVGDFTAGGNSLDNRLVGNEGNNILAGGLGRDTLEGGLGDDVYVVNDGLDTLIDTGGNDTIRTTLAVTLQADFENAELVGIGDPNATGNAANNRLVGNMGDNILDGLLGTDTLTGGLGSDQFMVGFNGSGVAVDQITDFLPGTDLLVVDLAALGIDVALLGLLSSGTVSDTSFVKGAGVQALDPGDQFLFDTARAVLSFDADGSGWQAPIDLVQLFGVSANNLTGNDIYIAV